MLERLNEEIRRNPRRAHLPNAEAYMRLVCALAVETYENRLEAHPLRVTAHCRA